jgi:hypothetical protein
MRYDLRKTVLSIIGGGGGGSGRGVGGGASRGIVCIEVKGAPDNIE